MLYNQLFLCKAIGKHTDEMPQEQKGTMLPAPSLAVFDKYKVEIGWSLTIPELYCGWIISLSLKQQAMQRTQTSH